MMINENSVELAKWLEGANKILADYYASNNPNNPVVRLEARFGKRYVKIVRVEGCSAGSVFAFIDRVSGDVLKPASWKAPAKHARGNLFFSDGGLDNVGPFGPAYLK